MKSLLDTEWMCLSGRDLCSPSKLPLRAACPGSARLERDTERSNHKLLQHNPAAERGTMLHDKSEMVCSKQKGEEYLNDLPVEDKQQVLWTNQQTLEVIKRFAGKGAITQYEIQVDLSPLGISGGKNGCRIDVLIIIPGSGAVIIDWKYGRIWVTAPEWNLQLKAYAWGINHTYGGNIETIILQPQSPEDRNYMSHVFTDEDFKVIGAQIKEIVSNAKAPGAPLIRGPHCENLFCSCRGSVCPLWKKSLLEIPDGKNVASYFEMLSPEDRANFLDRIKTIQYVADHCYSVVSQLCVDHGVEIGGRWYVGDGEPSYVCGDKGKYLNALTPFAEAKGLTGEDLLTTPKESMPKSKSEAHKLLGASKPVTDAIESLYTVIPGNKTLKRRRS